MASGPLQVGIKIKEIGTAHTVYQGCTVLFSDTVGLVFETQRTLAEGGNVETVVSQVLVPWSNVRYVVLLEERL